LSGVSAAFSGTAAPAWTDRAAITATNSICFFIGFTPERNNPLIGHAIL
jgi:hypothetical protein